MMSARRWVWIVSLLLVLPAWAGAGDFERWVQAAQAGMTWQKAVEGLDAQALSEQGRTVAHVAARFNRIDWLEKLPAGLLGRADDFGNLPMHSAAWSGRLKSVRWLHEHGAALDAANRQGWQPLHMAIFNGHVELAQWLLNQHVPVNAVTTDGWTPVTLAIAQGECALLRELKAAGSDMTQSFKVYGHRYTPLALARTLGAAACVDLLSHP